MSGLALATGDCRHKGWETPAASAVPLTEESFKFTPSTGNPVAYTMIQQVKSSAFERLDAVEIVAKRKGGLFNDLGFVNCS